MAVPDLSTIITPEQVSAQLGVNATDISSDTMKASGVYDDLYLDLVTWFPKVMDLINDSTGDEKVSQQQMAIKAYGKFFVCHRLLMSGPLAFFQKFSDGSNDDRRFNIDFEKMKDDFDDLMAKAKGLVLGIDTPLTPADEKAAGYAVFGTSVPSFDNVRQ